MKEYDKKVLARFMHPKFAGEIKNADAVGQVGNAACLLSNQIIFVNDELKPIKDVSKIQKVISHNSNKEKIYNLVLKNGTNGKNSSSLLCVNNKFYDIDEVIKNSINVDTKFGRGRKGTKFGIRTINLGLTTIKCHGSGENDNRYSCLQIYGLKGLK